MQVTLSSSVHAILITVTQMIKIKKINCRSTNFVNNWQTEM